MKAHQPSVSVDRIEVSYQWEDPHLDLEWVQAQLLAQSGALFTVLVARWSGAYRKVPHGLVMVCVGHVMI